MRNLDRNALAKLDRELLFICACRQCFSGPLAANGDNEGARDVILRVVIADKGYWQNRGLGDRWNQRIAVFRVDPLTVVQQSPPSRCDNTSTTDQISYRIQQFVLCLFALCHSQTFALFRPQLARRGTSTFRHSNVYKGSGVGSKCIYGNESRASYKAITTTTGAIDSICSYNCCSSPVEVVYGKTGKVQRNTLVL